MPPYWSLSLMSQFTLVVRLETEVGRPALPLPISQKKICNPPMYKEILPPSNSIKVASLN